MVNKELWTALYAPALRPDEVEPSQFDLESKEAAWDYVFSQMCVHCKEERQRVLDGVGEYYESDFPGCAHEWDVMLTSDYEKAESTDDLMKAAGWETVYTRKEGDRAN